MSSSTPSKGPSALVRFAGLEMSDPAKRAFQTGNRKALISELAYGLDLGLDDIEPRAMVLLERVAELAIEVRRESIAVIGSHEAFVRKTKQGDLSQIIRPVRLALGNKTLWQMGVKRPVDVETGALVGNTKTYKGNYEWRMIPAEPGRASVTYTGFLAMNAVAGCAVGQPPHVWVDGEKRTNPYVERVKRREGRLGDVIRVVIAVAVVGPAPGTGNPVVVNYTLDYDPGKDFANMLSALGDDNDDCHLAVEPDELEKGWMWHPVYGGVGFLFNLRNKDVFKSYGKFIEMQANALKKAQTVARRNAMKSHPALAIHDVVINANGEAYIPVTGWAGDRGAMERWTKLQSRLAQGMPLDDEIDVNVIDLEPEAYDAATDGEQPAEMPTTDTLDPEQKERGELMEYIDTGIGMLSPGKVKGLGYDPAKNSLEDLRRIRDDIDTLTAEV